MNTTKEQALAEVRTLGAEWAAGNRTDDHVRDELIAMVRVATDLYVPEYTLMGAAGISRTTIRKWTR